jgi:hypothetical protein
VETLPGTFIWAPPLAALLIAPEEIRKASIKRQGSMHIFILPIILTPEWLKQIFKAADTILQVPIGCPKESFEALAIGLSLHFISGCQPLAAQRNTKDARSGSPNVLNA